MLDMLNGKEIVYFEILYVVLCIKIFVILCLQSLFDSLYVFLLPLLLVFSRKKPLQINFCSTNLLKPSNTIRQTNSRPTGQRTNKQMYEGVYFIFACEKY